MTKHSIDDEESVALVVIPSSSSCHIFVSALNPFYKDLSETWYENHIKIFET